MADKKKESLAWMEPNDLETGEAVTGFEKGGDRGPFNCGNCVHYSKDLCTHPVMVRMSSEPKEGDGIKVEDEDCCKYQRRPEAKKEKKDKAPQEKE